MIATTQIVLFQYLYLFATRPISFMSHLSKLSKLQKVFSLTWPPVIKVGADMQAQNSFQQITWNLFCWLRDLKCDQSLNPHRLVCHNTVGHIPDRQTTKRWFPSNLWVKISANGIRWLTLKWLKGWKERGCRLVGLRSNTFHVCRLYFWLYLFQRSNPVI